MSTEPVFSPTEQDMMEGYRDGRDDTRDEYPSQSNRSAAYRHGWLNGRDDRKGKPRDLASVLRAQAEAILMEGTK